MRFHETLSSNTKSSSADVVLQKSYQLEIYARWRWCSSSNRRDR